MTFFNKSILILLLNANFEWGEFIFNGEYSDYNEKWFKTNGKVIVNFMIIQTFMPLVNVSITILITRVKRMWDQCRCCPSRYPENTETKTRTITQYYDLYSGPEYDIHYKYSELENICFLSFMYGPGIPILFPIGLLCIGVFYLVERLSLGWLYRKPRHYSS